MEKRNISLVNIVAAALLFLFVGALITRNAPHNQKAEETESVSLEDISEDAPENDWAAAFDYNHFTCYCKSAPLVDVVSSLKCHSAKHSNFKQPLYLLLHQLKIPFKA
ncbi:MAG: hypothetical protein KDC92_07165 [Bacteroidetes bacterium]|nr:hypothetical protein [Bacteroidota bacterium]